MNRKAVTLDGIKSAFMLLLFTSPVWLGLPLLIVSKLDKMVF